MLPAPLTRPSIDHGGGAWAFSPHRSPPHSSSAGSLLPPAYAAPPEATNTIAEVQGTGSSSPLEGQKVTEHGVVTGDYRTGGYNGITIQTQGTGGDTGEVRAASDGVFVFLGSSFQPE